MSSFLELFKTLASTEEAETSKDSSTAKGEELDQGKEVELEDLEGVEERDHRRNNSNLRKRNSSESGGYESDNSDFLSVSSGAFDSEKMEQPEHEEENIVMRSVPAGISSVDLLDKRMVAFSRPKFLGIPVRSTGIATLLFIAMFVSMLILFAAFFQLAEADAEIERNEAYVDLMARLKTSLEPALYDELVGFIGIDDTRGTEDFVSYVEETQTWKSFTLQSYASAYYYSFALSTTIGYGDIVTHTTVGKILTVIAILCTLPIAIVTYTRVANLLSSQAMKLILKRSQEFKAVLAKYDSDRNGFLDRGELKKALKDLGLPLSDEEITVILAEFDDNGDEVLDVDEFATVANHLQVGVGKLARQELKLRFAIATLLIFLVIFSLIAWAVMSTDFVDTLYFTIVTLSTVGLGDITPTSSARAWLTIPIFILLGLVALVIGSVTENLQSTEVHEETVASVRLKQEQNPKGSFVGMSTTESAKHKHAPKENRINSV